MPIESDTRQPFATQRGRVEEKERNVSHARCRRCANPHACAMKRKKFTRHQHLWQLRLMELYIRRALINAIPSQSQPFLLGKGWAHPFLHWLYIYKFIHVRSGGASLLRHRKKRQSMQATSNPAARNSIFKGVWFNCCCIWYSDCLLSALCGGRCCCWIFSEIELRTHQRDAGSNDVAPPMLSWRTRSLGRLEISFLNLLTWRTTTLFWLPLFMREWLFAQPLTEKLFRQGWDQMRWYNLIFTQETCFW